MQNTIKYCSLGKKKKQLKPHTLAKLKGKVHCNHVFPFYFSIVQVISITTSWFSRATTLLQQLCLTDGFFKAAYRNCKLLLNAPYSVVKTSARRSEESRQCRRFNRTGLNVQHTVL